MYEKLMKALSILERDGYMTWEKLRDKSKLSPKTLRKNKLVKQKMAELRKGRGKRRDVVYGADQEGGVYRTASGTPTRGRD